MDRQLVIRPLIALAALLLWGVQTRHVRAVAPADAAGPFLTRADAESSLPPGLSLPDDRGALTHIVRIVAADIDDDGDLDVIENDGSLELTVWENDGAGHLTKKRPVQSHGWQVDTPAPSWDGRGTSMMLWVQNDAPSLRVDLTVGGAPQESTRSLDTPAERPELALGRSCPSRAPPALT
jgi:hypothetical protein